MFIFFRPNLITVCFSRWISAMFLSAVKIFAFCCNNYLNFSISPYFTQFTI